ncbi:MAG: YhgE/Pip family protein [Sporolactobacillus sp.]
MQRILQVYLSDLRYLLRSPNALLVVIGLCILPSAYALINIASVWNPYARTSQLPVAIVNEDRGTVLNGKELDVGAALVRQLRKDHQLGWVFVNRREAEQQLKEGQYYASIRLPANFSTDITSILKNHSHRPIIDFTVNDKVNSITPKITANGASALTEQIGHAFDKKVGEALFDSFHQAGMELKQNLPLLEKVKAQVFGLERSLPAIDRAGQAAIQLDQKLAALRQKGKQLTGLDKRLSDLHKAGDQVLLVESILPEIQKGLDQTTLLSDHLNEMTSASQIISQLNQTLSELQKAISQAEDSAEVAASLSSASQNQTKLKEASQQLQAIQQELAALAQTVNQQIGTVDDLLQSASQFTKNDWPTTEKDIHLAADFVRQDLPQIETAIQQASELYHQRISDAVSKVNQAANFARNDLPGFGKEIHLAADKIRQFNSQVDLSEVIRLLTLDPQRQSDFLAQPVVLHTQRLFPIPNYGSAMAPFYTILSLWVGATLMISMLPARRGPGNMERKWVFHYLGRLSGFLSIGLMQALIVALGDLFLLHIYCVRPLPFFWFCLFSSLVFVSITFTLVTFFGTIGKGLSVILLILQISSSSGTFPVAMTSPFFQAISPYLPFTYAIRLIRETIGGIVPKVVYENFAFLLLFLVGTLLVGIGVTCYLSKENRRI